MRAPGGRSLELACSWGGGSRHGLGLFPEGPRLPTGWSVRAAFDPVYLLAFGCMQPSAEIVVQAVCVPAAASGRLPRSQPPHASARSRMLPRSPTPCLLPASSHSLTPPRLPPSNPRAAATSRSAPREPCSSRKRRAPRSAALSRVSASSSSGVPSPSEHPGRSTLRPTPQASASL